MSNPAEAAQAALFSANEEWKSTALSVITDFLRTRQTFTSDDVMRALAGKGVSTKEPRALGAILMRLSKEGKIKHSRFLQSTRPERNMGIVREWEVVKYEGPEVFKGLEVDGE